MICASCGKDRHADELSTCLRCEDKFCGFGECKGTCRCDFIATAKIVLVKARFISSTAIITKSAELILSSDTGLLTGPATYISG